MIVKILLPVQGQREIQRIATSACLCNCGGGYRMRNMILEDRALDLAVRLEPSEEREITWEHGGSSHGGKAAPPQNLERG